MTRVLINLGKFALVVLSGLAGAAAAFWIAFWGAFLSLRALASLTGNDQYMFLMWLVMPVGIAAAGGGFTGVAFFSAIFLYRRALARAAFPLEPERST